MDSIKYTPVLNQNFEIQSVKKAEPKEVELSKESTERKTAIGLSLNAPLGLGWAGFAGGIQGMAKMHEPSTASPQGSLETPGPKAMEAIKAAGAHEIGSLSGETIISIKSSPGLYNQSSDLTADEYLALQNCMSGLSDSGVDAITPELLTSKLNNEYGLSCEVFDLPGNKESKKAIINKSTGHVLFVGGNNGMGAKDKNFIGVLSQLKGSEISPDLSTPAVSNYALPTQKPISQEAAQGLEQFKAEPGINNAGSGDPSIYPEQGIWSNPVTQKQTSQLMTQAFKYAQLYGK